MHIAHGTVDHSLSHPNIGIEEEEVVTCCFLCQAAAGMVLARPAAGQFATAYQPDAEIVCGKLFYNPCGIIGGLVVEDDDLPDTV